MNAPTTQAMSPQQAHDALQALLAVESTDPAIRAAWAALTAGIRAGRPLPEQWQRLTSAQAAERAGTANNMWANLVNQGYAPPHDGLDSIGRKYWRPSTVDRYLSVGYRKGWPE